MNLKHSIAVFLAGFRARPNVRRSAIIYKGVIFPESCYAGERVKLKGSIGRFPKFGENCFVNDDSLVWGGCTFGNHVRINTKVHVQDCNHDVNDGPAPINGRTSFDSTVKPVKIGDHVTLDTGCYICKGVTIGDGAIVMAGAVVFDNVAPRAVVQGNPARWIGYRINPTTKEIVKNGSSLIFKQN